MNLTLDIETIPTEDPAMIEDIAARVLPPANYKKPETIQKWEQEEKPGIVAEKVAATALDGTFGRVACIGFAIDDDMPRTFMLQDERSTLEAFCNFRDWQRLDLVIGHNVTWDLRFLWKRCIVNSIKMPYPLLRRAHAKPWDDTIGDTMLRWDPVNKVSLDRLCRALGIASPKNGGMDGSKVYEAWKAGEYDRIAEYCRGDVVAARECWKRMN